MKPFFAKLRREMQDDPIGVGLIVVAVFMLLVIFAASWAFSW
jgi:hypothetical protein|tara:strand:+ start:266 stop:391 length:126 start_codon:yes stop_codon:yes gene_type:complete